MNKKENRITIRWTGLVHRDLEGEFEDLLARLGYECTGRGRDIDGDKERVLIFRPASTAAVNYLCPECHRECMVVWVACPPLEDVECGECGARALRI